MDQMRDYFFFEVLNMHTGEPVQSALDRIMAVRLRGALEEFIERPGLIDLILCERCDVYVMLIGDHGCAGVQ